MGNIKEYAKQHSLENATFFIFLATATRAWLITSYFAHNNCLKDYHYSLCPNPINIVSHASLANR